MVWLAIILVPVLTAQMMSELHVNLGNVLTAWRKCTLLHIIFIVHNCVIAPASCSRAATHGTWR